MPPSPGRLVRPVRARSLRQPCFTLGRLVGLWGTLSIVVALRAQPSISAAAGFGIAQWTRGGQTPVARADLRLDWPVNSALALELSGFATAPREAAGRFATIVPVPPIDPDIALPTTARFALGNISVAQPMRRELQGAAAGLLLQHPLPSGLQVFSRQELVRVRTMFDLPYAGTFRANDWGYQGSVGVGWPRRGAWSYSGELIYTIFGRTELATLAATATRSFDGRPALEPHLVLEADAGLAGLQWRTSDRAAVTSRTGAGIGWKPTLWLELSVSAFRCGPTENSRTLVIFSGPLPVPPPVRSPEARILIFGPRIITWQLRRVAEGKEIGPLFSYPLGEHWKVFTGQRIIQSTLHMWSLPLSNSVAREWSYEPSIGVEWHAKIPTWWRFRGELRRTAIPTALMTSGLATASLLF